MDNIEDCHQPGAWKQQRLAEAAQLLEQPALVPEVLAQWQQYAWPGLTPPERQIMGVSGGLPLWQIYAAIPAESRQIIRHWVLEMVKGMGQLDSPARAPHFVQQQGVQVLARETDYNQYCYIVAGTVGHLGTELVIQHYRLTHNVGNRLLQGCEACGRSLQKTNIVKDFAKDLERGIAYLPQVWLQEGAFAPLALQGASAAWSRKVLDDVLHELDEATDYVLALPYETGGYRMASLLCLLPALQTILLAAKRQRTLFTPEHRVKISRPTMARCVWDAKRMLNDNEAVVNYVNRLRREMAEEFKVRNPL